MQRNMKIDQPVDLLVQVRKSGIRVERDGQSFLDWNGSPSQLSLGPTWDDKGSPRLFLGAQATFVIHRLEFLPLTNVDSQSQWIDLFNGKDLTGWKEMGVKYWSVTNGVIVGKTASNSGWLMSERVYGDYELEFDYKLSPSSNSGLFLRAWPEGNINGNQFREIQLLDDEAPAFSTLQRDRRTGSIFGMVAPHTTPKAPANQWHRVRVLLQGQQVEVSINGIDVLKHTLNDLPPLGRIGLQLFPTQVEFRNLRVRPLDSATGSR